MSKVRAIVADDERQVRDDLVRMLTRLWPELDILAVAENGEQAVNLLHAMSPDVAFLDIKMPLKTGVEVAEMAGQGSFLVFITAYEDYAVKAFDQAAIDYLLKPVQEKRLMQTIERLKAALSGGVRIETNDGCADKAAESRSEREMLRWLRVSHGDTVVILSTEDVIYFRAGDKYTTVVTADKSYLIRKPISELEQELDPANFWRIHRGTIVNARQISQVRKGLNGSRIISLKNSNDKLTASRSYRYLFDQM